MKNLKIIEAVIAANREAGDNIYEGLTSAEIGRYNQSLMFGDTSADEWDEDEWSAWVD